MAHNINVHLEASIMDKFRELKLFLKADTNEETQEKIINIAYKDIKKGEKS